MTTFDNIFLNTLKLNGMEEYTERSEVFHNLFKSLVETNKLYNLTAVTDENGVCALHFCDSLFAEKYIKDGAAMLDIGCGAGFPSLPIAIARPDVTILAVDSTAKKTEFSRKFAAENNLSNFTSLAARAEELAKTDKRESFDLVTARAVARLNVLAELALPFVKVGGYFLAMKGSAGEDEYKEAAKGIAELGGKLEKIEKRDLILPDGKQGRTLILIRKVRETAQKYPRMYAKIVKKPL
ncbi:MAG: 16S rRNA (guanine(527)-N(7))-methyltransferase RsmG [Ruminococcaceae bacterium]|nr:16S rRNA (guanine(527)-N(7))-methyltransferase RsmG [Oscillospiraceae bacterium]